MAAMPRLLAEPDDAVRRLLAGFRNSRYKNKPGRFQGFNAEGQMD
jgi:hypothetical protein